MVVIPDLSRSVEGVSSGPIGREGKSHAQGEGPPRERRSEGAELCVENGVWTSCEELFVWARGVSGNQKGGWRFGSWFVV